MTIDDRVRHAMSGLKLRTDEVGRPASHEEVEAMLRKTLEDAEAELVASVSGVVEKAVADALDKASMMDEDTQS